MSSNNKIYFLSDFHLGAPDHSESLIREKRIVSFLDEARKDAQAIFILGDLFDFWYEYKYVVPKGYVRILGKLAEITDQNIPIHFFVGNHDMWMNNYFQKELNISVYYKPTPFELHGKKFLIGHGDGLGPGDHGYKFLKKIFRNSILQKLFGMIPPSIGIGIANYFSKKSRVQTGKSNEVFMGEDKEWLVCYCKEELKKNHCDYFIFGHRHLPLQIELPDNSIYFNLGDWIQYNSYVEFDGNAIALKYFKQ